MPNDSQKRTLTSEAATERLMAICSKKETSEGDALRKLTQWGVNTEKHEEILTSLRKHGFIDNLRFALAFANDKAKFNKWGPKKIEQALAFHRIPKAIIEMALKSLNMVEYTLLDVLTKKARTIKAKDEQEWRNKLIRFGLSRGFDLDAVIRATKQIER